MTEKRFATLAVSEGEEPDGDGVGDVVSPIHMASTFALPELDPELSLAELDPSAGEYLYSRLSNPTRQALEERLAAIEGGDHAFAFGSGTAAISSLGLSILEPGDHVVAFEDLYGGTKSLFDGLFEERLNVEFSYVDARDPENVAEAMRPETRLVWMETPTNPLMQLCDIDAIADIVGDEAVLGVDNTFLSPYFQQPLELGADVVAHSTTKFINGHTDSVGGALVTDDETLAEAVLFTQKTGVGAPLDPFDSYMVLRGVKTLPVRMRKHEANAQVVAEYLADHDLVEDVYYPGLESHPQHELASEQASGYGGVLSFDLVGDMADARRFLESLEVFTLAVSLGGVESLIELPAGMTHEPLDAAEREELGITDTLVRASVGIEDIDDLIADIDRGFQAMEASRTGAR